MRRFADVRKAMNINTKTYKHHFWLPIIQICDNKLAHLRISIIHIVNIKKNKLSQFFDNHYLHCGYQVKCL